MTHDAPAPAAPRATPEVLRYTAFSADPQGGNPAGVVLDAAGLADAEQLAIAAELGYSETAFLTPPPAGLGEPGRAFTIRYFSPLAEVAFCGHATVATAIALAERTGPGDLVFATPAGPVPVTVTRRGGALRATLTSVEPRITAVAPADLAEALPPSAGPPPTSTRRCRPVSPTRATSTSCWLPPPASGWRCSTTTSSGWPP